MADKRITIRFGAKGTRELDNATRRIRNTLGGIRAQAVGAAAGMAAFLGAALSFRSVLDATRKQEQALAQLEARLQSTGGVVGLTSQQIQDLASSMQELTTYGDEAVIEMQNLLLTFTNIRGSVFEQTTLAVLNMATAMGQDLRSSALLVGKALQDPVRGLTALTRSGVVFTQQQKDIIRSLVETNRVADAQRLILRELETQFGGAAAAAANTFSGAVDQVSNAFGDLLEQREGLSEAKTTMQELAATLKDPAVAKGLNDLVAGAASLAGFFATIASEFAALSKGTGDAAAKLINGGESFGDLLEAQERVEEKRRRLLERGVPATAGAIRDLDRQLEALNKKLKPIQDIRRLQGIGTSTPATPGSTTADNPTGAAYNVDIGTSEADKAAKQQEKRINRIVDALKEQAATYGLSAEQIALYRLRLTEASPNELQAARNAIALIEAKKQQAEADKEAADAIAEAERQNAAIFEQSAQANADLEQQAQRWRDLINPVNAYQRQLEEIDRLYNLGKISAETYADATFRIQDAIDAIGDKADEAGSNLNQFAIQAARNIQNQLGNTLFNIADTSFQGLLRSWSDMLRQMASQALAAQIGKKLLGEGFGETGNLGGLLGGLLTSFGLFHQGGIVGQSAPGRRMVSPLAFLAAPRYHGGSGVIGLRDDEVPAILQKGERVLNRQEAAAYGQQQSGNLTAMLHEAVAIR